MKALFQTTFFLLQVFGSAWFAMGAGVISVNYTLESSAMQATEVAGAPGVRVPNWNNAFTAGGNTTLDLPAGTILDDSGAVVDGLAIELFTGNAGSTSQRGNPPGGTAPVLQDDGRMLRTVTDKFEGGEGLITVTGIPYARYHLYFYVYPDAGGGGERGGYFSVTNSTGQTLTRWLKGGTGASATIPMPDPLTGEGYRQSQSSAQPSTFGDIQPGHFVMISDLTETNIVIRYSAVGAGSGGVTGGDSVRRLKFSGFQIAEAQSGTVSSISLPGPIPPLYSGNPLGYSVQVLGNYATGGSAPVQGVTFASAATNIFTVSSNGVVQPGNPGVANLVMSYQNLGLTQQVTVLQPVVVRPVIPVELVLRGSRVQAALFADFDGATDVNVTSFMGVSFGGGAADIAVVSSNGLIHAIGEGQFNLSGTYAGVTGQTTGTVVPYDPPQPEGGKVAVSLNLQSGNAMTFTDLAGAPGVRVGSWNNLTGLTSGGNTVVLGPGTVADSSGAVVAGMSVSLRGGTGAGLSTRGWQSGNESTMFNGVYDQFNGTPGMISISGIPFAVYDAYFYVLSGDADSRPGHFTIADQTRWVLDTTSIPNPDNDGNGYVEAVTTNAPSSVAEIEPGNYVRFSNLRGTTLEVKFVADDTDAVPDASTVPRLKFAGLQLVGIPSPVLQATQASGGNLQISWSTAAVGFTLKSNVVLSGVWHPVNVNPATNGATLSVTVPASASRAFFILQK